MFYLLLGYKLAEVKSTLAYYAKESITTVKNYDIGPRRGHDTWHNDIQHNDIQHNDIQHNDIQHDDIQHNDIQHK